MQIRYKTVNFIGTMLDACRSGAEIPLQRGYLSERSGDPASAGILDIQELAGSETQKHRVSSLPGRSSVRAKTGNQDPESRNIANAFQYNGLNPKKRFFVA
jgi:hypothetical protein